MNPEESGQPSQAPLSPQPVAPVQPAQPLQPAGGTVDPAAAVQSALNEAGPVAAPDPGVVAGGDDTSDIDDEAHVSWTAHEYIHHEKGMTWFVLFTVLMIALLGLSIWTQAWSFAVLIVVITVVMFIFARRPPRELTYSLTDEGLTVDGGLHKYEEFKSFGVIEDGEHLSVMLIPVQRFQPGLTVYFPEDAGEDIVDVLGSRMPMKELHLDMVDRLARFFRL